MIKHVKRTFSEGYSYESRQMVELGSAMHQITYYHVDKPSSDSNKVQLPKLRIISFCAFHTYIHLLTQIPLPSIFPFFIFFSFLPSFLLLFLFKNSYETRIVQVFNIFYF